MVDRAALLDDLKRQVKAVETDLAAQVKAVPEVGERLREEYARAHKLGRTAATWNSWLDERVTQAAAAWVLGTVFVRFAEDNHLIPEPYLTGPQAERRDLAQARYEAYVDSDPDPTYRGWLQRAFAELGTGHIGELLFDADRNPLFQIPLSHDGARALVEFWRERNEDGALVHDFTDPLNEDGTKGWDTRFLGDLYQDLSEEARSRYALLQTPEFVEEFILDRTMNLAVREFGYEELRMIDPTCGSGHFVLGAFRRLVKLWADRQPTREVHERVRAALDSVHGVDVNPFAVAIARFRLLVAAMAAANIRTFAEAGKYDWPIHLAVGDSLIKARQLELTLEGEESGDELAEFTYATEDVHEHPRILEPGRYHVVVGNPPYITVKDSKLNKLYRTMYDACSGKYALSVPFAQRFFELAKRGDAEGNGYGRVGQITANSFMKREFGTRLIEEYFAHQVELTEVIDTSGAYIPGHGTPTVILVGIRRGGKERSATIRTVRSVQGEPAAPENPEDGLVWNAIVNQINEPGSVSKWVSVDDLERERYFNKQPWILADGGLELNEQISDAKKSVLRGDIARIGFYGITGSDDAMTAPLRTFRVINGEDAFVKRLVVGDEVRDFGFLDGDDAFHPYDANRDLQKLDSFPRLACWLWPSRTELGNRATFSGGTYFSDNHPWWGWHQLPKDQGASDWSITFAFVATHNHFVLDRGGKVFKQSAPVIKLREGASEEDHLRLLGLLNSSTACFWLKMVSHSKGTEGHQSGIKTELWEQFYEFTGTKLEKFPLPSSYPTTLATELDSLAQELSATTPSAIAEAGTPTAATLREARAKWESTRARMIALQEELDWQVYFLYSLNGEDLRVPDPADVPELALGERAFEIALARRVAAGEASGEWFTRHGSTPITDIPTHWPEPYRQVVQKRIDAIESSRAIGMVERPECKRRWATEGWDAMQQKALRSWLLDRMEDRAYFYDENGLPALVSLSRLADALSRDEDFVAVAGIYAPRTELADVVAELITEEHVPFLAALRYKPTGLKKRADWEHVWELQRQEDAAPDEPAKRRIRDSIPVPPKYTSADFLRSSYWRARGKLDVPKERFISYGSTNTATPELYGWAGWDHREQAQALATYFTNQALSTEEITPFLAGLLELQPWLDQWHNEFDITYSGTPAGFFANYRQQIQGEHGLTDDDLRAWRPAKAGRGRRTARK
ncbi:BREX-2 system adenine-specific DNA-methyltransferase PglX [Allosalinactinospora lopnorensis]|uniref:BREX-2 system adenine-specific DNA-methyltransferase PglX n=1 Tax=Allosalinactinospora lopnorensis TaxID=1352348 RepID=UPI000623F1ED|nr:BREX-2 system adenine-specific DNA-methyltransferase PglX [Allosalinactinospora lopnorensis]